MPRTILAVALALALGCGGSSGRAGGSAGTGGTGGSAGTGGGGGQGSGGDDTPPAAGSSAEACALATSLGRDHLLIGVSNPCYGCRDYSGDARWDLRYQYISSGIAPGAGPCTSCADGSCGSWWGCGWQESTVPPGTWLPRFIEAVKGSAMGAQIPMLTYYQLLPSMNWNEGYAEVEQVSDVAFMSRYLADWRFLLQKIGSEVMLLHVEPDFLGYAGQYAIPRGIDCSGIPAAVASADAADCGSYPNTLAGLGQCMIAMARAYAPNAKVGLHASGWGTNIDVLMNTDPSFDVGGEARKLGEFLVSCGAGEGDFIVADMNDVDAGTNGKWWDATNGLLPSFHQAFTWAKALSEAVGRPLLWWQVPVGNTSLSDTAARDNRLDYIFDHPDELSASHTVGVAFGAGNAGIANPENDGGHLASRTNDYQASGGTELCP